MIRTLEYGIVPIAVNTTYVHNKVIDTVECCNGEFYTLHRAFSGSIVAVLNNDWEGLKSSWQYQKQIPK